MLLRRLLALWLVVLIVVPCAAPFATCQLRDLVGGAGRAGETLPPTTSSRAVLDDASACLVPSVNAVTTKRLKSTTLTPQRRPWSSPPRPLAQFDPRIFPLVRIAVGLQSSSVLRL